MRLTKTVWMIAMAVVMVWVAITVVHSSSGMRWFDKALAVGAGLVVFWAIFRTKE